MVKACLAVVEIHLVLLSIEPFTVQVAVLASGLVHSDLLPMLAHTLDVLHWRLLILTKPVSKEAPSLYICYHPLPYQWHSSVQPPHIINGVLHPLVIPNVGEDHLPEEVSHQLVKVLLDELRVSFVLDQALEQVEEGSLFVVFVFIETVFYCVPKLARDGVFFVAVV